MLRRSGLLLVALIVIVMMAACGGGGNGGTPSGPSTITAVSVSCSPGTVGSDGSSQCSATVTGTGSFSTGVTWSASAGSISTSGLLTAPVVTTSKTVTVTATSTQDTSIAGSATVTVNPQAAGANVAPLIVDAGPLPQTNPSVNTAYATVTVCVPNTTDCQTIDHITVDTGSVGLRLISGVLSLSLPQTSFDECLVFLDGFIWGPVATADITVSGTVSGEMASSAPVQIIIPSSAPPAVPSSCSSQNPSGGVGNEGNSVADFGANGIIGVGLFAQDCGLACTNLGDNLPPDAYYSCVGSSCSAAFVPLAQQVTNPVTLFPVDNNGVLIQFPNVPDGGSLDLAGSLIFGIGTESNNGLGGAQVYDVPDSGDNAGSFTTNFNGNVYTGSFVDSGSNAYYFIDSSVQQCGSENPGWYCPTTSPLPLSASNQGTNMSSPITINFDIENADTLFSGNNTAFSTLAAPYPSTPVEFDWGLSFFYGRNVFTAIDGASTPGGTGPYFAF